MITPIQHAKQQKHTPGPWGIGFQKSNRWVLNNGQGRAFGCFQGWSADGVTTEEDTANARLIAAAPALFDALTLALKCADDHGADHFGYGEYVSYARAALLAATCGCERRENETLTEVGCRTKTATSAFTYLPMGEFCPACWTLIQQSMKKPK